MTKKKNGDTEAIGIFEQCGSLSQRSAGMTKREYFAAEAMSGLLASGSSNFHEDDATALYAVNHADALLKELQK